MWIIKATHQKQLSGGRKFLPPDFFLTILEIEEVIHKNKEVVNGESFNLTIPSLIYANSFDIKNFNVISMKKQRYLINACLRILTTSKNQTKKKLVKKILTYKNPVVSHKNVIGWTLKPEQRKQKNETNSQLVLKSSLLGDNNPLKLHFSSSLLLEQFELCR